MKAPTPSIHPIRSPWRQRLVQEALAHSELFKGVWSDPQQSRNAYEGKVAVQLGKSSELSLKVPIRCDLRP